MERPSGVFEKMHIKTTVTYHNVSMQIL